MSSEATITGFNCSMSIKKTAADLKAHLRKRATERYDLNLNKDDIREINTKIQSNQAQFVERQSYSRSLWKVEHEGQTLNVVYNNNLHTACTVLPQDAVQFQGQPQTPPEPFPEAQPPKPPKKWDLEEQWQQHIGEQWFKND